tara:strand:+ start:635 stop:1009 length:375 start_codon:yes stop_codon:yes gene_type:complete
MPSAKINKKSKKGNMPKPALPMHKTNSWEEEDVKRGKEQQREGHFGHAKALFDDAHGSYNYKGDNMGHESPNKMDKEYGSAMPMKGSWMSRHSQNLLNYNPIDDKASALHLHDEFTKKNNIKHK